MNKTKIQIGIPCGKNSEKYTKFLVDSINKTKSTECEIEFIIGVNQKGVNLDLLNELLISTKNKKIVKSEGKHSGGVSQGHGLCADMILNNMDSGYGMLVDADAAFLLKNWDKKITPHINNKTICLGTEYGIDDKKYMKNPNAIAILFDVDVYKSINFTWQGELKHIIIDKTNAHIYNRDIGEKIFLDTGSRLPKFLHDNGYNGKYLELLSPRISETKYKMKFLSDGMRGDEYQLKGEPIFTHLGRSTSRDFDTSPEAQVWKKAVLNWLNKN